MSRERDKGNRLERAVIPRLIRADGVDPRFTELATGCGRVGNAYHLEVDGVTSTLAIECKNRESLGLWLWELLDHIPDWIGKRRIAVLKRNRRRPLVLIDLDDFISILEERNAAQPD